MKQNNICVENGTDKPALRVTKYGLKYHDLIGVKWHVIRIKINPLRGRCLL